jgi:hypothetical protein
MTAFACFRFAIPSFPLAPRQGGEGDRNKEAGR